MTINEASERRIQTVNSAKSTVSGIFDLVYNYGYAIGYGDKNPDIDGPSLRKPELLINSKNSLLNLIDSVCAMGYNLGIAIDNTLSDTSTYQDGYTVGYTEGQTAGRAAGYTSGKIDGKVEGMSADNQSMYDSGYDSGYDAGYNAAAETNPNMTRSYSYTYMASRPRAAGMIYYAAASAPTVYYESSQTTVTATTDWKKHYDEGYDAGYKVGYRQGKWYGEEKGEYNGYQWGYARGITDVSTKCDASYQEGYQAGYAAARAGSRPGPVSGDPVVFSTLLDKFNTALNSMGIGSITQANHSSTYQYLLAGFNRASTEWNDSDSNLFKESTYPEIPQVSSVSGYRGTNTEYRNVSYNAMQSWLMAMSLAELVPSDAGSGLSNNQTVLFKTAYEFAGGLDVPLYGGYDLHADPTIARLAAGAIYAILRGAKSYADMDAMRSELGYVNPLSGAEQEYDLHFYTGSYDYTSVEDGMLSLGYLVNMKAFLPGPFGPAGQAYSVTDTGYMDRPHKNFPYSSNNTDLIKTSGFNWEKYNYKVDVDYDEAIINNYRFYKFTDSDLENGTGLNVWNEPSDQTSRDNMQRMIEAAALGYCTNLAFFVTKKFKYDNTLTTCSYVDNEGQTHVLKDNAGNNIVKCLFTETTDSVSNRVYQYTGPFSDLAGILAKTGSVYNGGYYQNGVNVQLYDSTENMKYLNILMSIADDSRLPIMAADSDGWGRTRPGDLGLRLGPRSAVQQSPLNGIDCCSIAALMADTSHGSKDGVDKYRGEKMDDFPNNSSKPKSYPSGHNTQVWMLAMLLGQMQSGNGHSDKIIEYMQKAYRFGVNRAIARAHWLSDIIYGRLFATMILPIINAMTSEFAKYGYNHVKSDMNSGTLSAWTVSFPETKEPVNTDGPTGESITVYVNVANSSSVAISCNGTMGFMPYGLHSNGIYNGYYRAKGQCAPWTLEPGQSTTVTVTLTFDGNSGYETFMNNLPFADESNAGTYSSNIAFYDTAGYSRRLKSLSDAVLQNGATYTTYYDNTINNALSKYVMNDSTGMEEEVLGYEWNGGTWY